MLLQEVLGNTELMIAHSRSGSVANSVQTEGLEHIQQGAARAAAVVRDLVAFTDTVSLSARWHDVNDIVDRAIEASRRDLEAHRIQVERAPLERVPMAYLDGRQLEKVLGTLIARPAYAPAATIDAAGPKPVSVTISVTRVARPEDHVVIVVADNGWKADDQQMSLTAARRVVDAHGGSLDITPGADGVGSRATIELPIAATNKAAAAAAEENARSWTRSSTSSTSTAKNISKS